MLNLDLAWKNLKRKPLRSLLLLLAISISFAAALLAAAWNDGYQQKMVNDAIELELGHGQIHRPGWLDDRNQNNTISDSKQILRKLSKIPGIAMASRRGIISAMASSSRGSYGVRLIGVDPASEAKVSIIDDCLVKGVFLKSSLAVLMGNRLADRLQVKLGNRIVVTFQDQEGYLSGASLLITGIFHSPSATLDESSLYIRLQDLNQLLGTGDSVHEIVFRVKKDSDYRVVTALIQKNLSGMGLDIRSWEKVQPDLATVAAMNRDIMGLFLMLITLAVGLALANIMLMIVQERSREIGMQKAVGMKQGLIGRQLLLETFILYIFGGSLGLIFAYPGTFLFSAGKEFQMMIGSATLESYLGSVLLCGMVSAWIARRWIKKVRLPEALR